MSDQTEFKSTLIGDPTGDPEIDLAEAIAASLGGWMMPLYRYNASSNESRDQVRDRIANVIQHARRHGTESLFKSGTVSKMRKDRR